MPPPKAIARAQRELFLSLPNVADFLEEAHKVCWACGFNGPRFTPTRAHIKARVHGGSDDPSNFFLLCEKCHKEQPDAASLGAQTAWLRHHEHHLNAIGREVVEFLETLKKIAKERNAEGLNPEGLLEEWCEGMTTDKIAELARNGGGKSASFRCQNAASNYKWAIAQAFLDWLDANRSFK